MTTATVLLLRLRSSGIVLTATGESGLDFEGPEAVLTPEVVRGIQGHKASLRDLVAAAWWPNDRPRPSVMGLGTQYGAAAVRAALLELGCDLSVRTPSWEELFVVAESLGAGSPPSLPTSPADWPEAWLDEYQERLAICRHDGGLALKEARRVAEADCRLEFGRRAR